MKPIYFLILVFSLSFTSWGQSVATATSILPQVQDSGTTINLKRVINLESDSKSKTVTINIEENTLSFYLTIESTIHSGELMIEIYDSQDIKQGNFSVGTQLNTTEKDVSGNANIAKALRKQGNYSSGTQTITSGGESVYGNIVKSLRDPKPGKWEVKIIPTNAKGNVRINTKSNK